MRHHLVLAFEEVLAVERQVVHLLAVDVDVAVLLQLGAGHLANEAVEHRAFGHVEGRCVVDQRVAAIGQLHLRAGDDYAVQVYIFIDVIVGALLLLDEHAGQLEPRVAGNVAQLVDHRRVLVAVGGGADDEVVVLGGHLELVVARGAPGPAGHGVHDGAVLAHECHEGFHLGLGERVVDLAREFNLTFFLLAGLGRVRLGRCLNGGEKDAKECDDCVFHFEKSEKGERLPTDSQLMVVNREKCHIMLNDVLNFPA